MTKDTFTTFQRFQFPEEAEEMIGVLQKAGIPFDLQDQFPSVELTFSESPLAHTLAVLLRPRDFEKARQLLAAHAPLTIGDPDHYLHKFKDAELMEVLEQQDEWGAADVKGARQILFQRGLEVSDAEIAEMQARRLASLRKPQAGDKKWFTIGLIAAFFGGFIAIGIGWVRISSKKALPNGEKVFLFDKTTRRNGKFLIGLGTAMGILQAILIAYLN